MRLEFIESAERYAMIFPDVNPCYLCKQFIITFKVYFIQYIYIYIYAVQQDTQCGLNE
jgi:hypothetical protein